MIIAGNWKMHKLAGEARKLASDLKARLSKLDSPVTVVLCPPFTALAEVAAAVSGTDMLLGGQNMYWEEKGAYTGEVSPSMLKDAGCAVVIIGHSERRQIFGETDETVNKKVRAALKAGLKPIICVGETERQRDQGKTETVIVEQVQNGLANLSREEAAKLIIAYEPVWAIGTGKNATPEQAQEVHALIRSLLADTFDRSAASSLPILYGGSVKPDNADELLAQPDINGALVGGASLDGDSFEKIVRAGVRAAGK
jgi:triosephosphate isomerase